MPANGDSKRRKASSLLRLSFLSSLSICLVAFCLVSVLHLVALWVFGRGFLLHRIALSDRTACSDCTLPARYDRLVLLVVDALRDDFIFPLPVTAPEHSHFHHNILTAPAELSRDKPNHARSFRFVADPPTTTLQRLKGLTVGTLPTFIDAGSNFVGSEAEEDSWLEQARRAGKRIAFMGDDTWLTVFPPSTEVFAPNLTFPYDSFNVEDLDTVDNGVREHLYPLLDERKSESWDILIGHFLGLDHVGHRVGPYHSEMTRKLREADEVVRHVVGKLQRGDLFVLLGDHGMDGKGDHGGDSALEVNAALFLYSPAGDLAPSRPSPKLNEVLRAIGSESHFERGGQQQRSVAQISLVPTLSLLLGLPIPFSNLGTLIPDLFDAASLERGMQLNAKQVAGFLRAYTAEGAGPDLAARTPALLAQHDAVRSGAEGAIDRAAFLSDVLELSRAVWATFDVYGMAAGLVLLLGGLACAVKLFVLAGRDGTLWRSGALRQAVGIGVAGLLGGTLLGACAALLPQVEAKLRFACGVGAFASEVTMLSSRTPVIVARRQRWSWTTLIGVAMPIVHAFSFASNSFIVWEDRVVLTLLLSTLLALAAAGFATADARLRRRMLLFGFASAICMRLAAIPRLCREEQQGADLCTTTFYGHDRIWMIASAFCSLILPHLILRFLAIARADGGLARFVLNIGMHIALLCSSAYWALETRDSWTPLKNALAWTAYSIALVGALLVWRRAPLTLLIEQQEQKVALIGFANTFGASYTLYLSFAFTLVYAVVQPAGHFNLTMGFIALLCALEASDARRDAAGLEAQAGPDLLELSLLPLWAHVLFFGTGHQATLASLQWKSAFIGLRTVTYPLSPLLVALNTLGPLSLLPVLAAPLLALWNVSPPLPSNASNVAGTPSAPMLRRTLRALLGVQAIYTLLALSSATCAAWLRRHLMVWKIFAPRFMLASVALVAVDVGAVLLVWLGGVSVVLGSVKRVFKTEWAIGRDEAPLSLCAWNRPICYSNDPATALVDSTFVMVLNLQKRNIRQGGLERG